MKYFYFLIVKMAANYAKIGRVGRLQAGFEQVPVQTLWNFHNIVVKHQKLKIWRIKQKHVLLDKTKFKDHFSIGIA